MEFKNILYIQIFNAFTFISDTVAVIMIWTVCSIELGIACSSSASVVETTFCNIMSSIAACNSESFLIVSS